MSAYREPDQTARIEELEAEVARLKAENLRQGLWARLGDWCGEYGPGTVGLVFVMSVVVAVFYFGWRAEQPEAKPTTLYDGRSGAAVSCSNPSDCVVLAGRTCTRGYEAVEKSQTWLLIACREAK